MQRALSLARLGRGRTGPNPMVGAVIVKDGRIVGEGYHQRAGEPHAEIHALRQGGEAARGATLYVNLEPCPHWGRTPPCTQAIIAAGITEAHVAMLDPNPLVNGRGRDQLEEAGIRVWVGEREAEARELNEAFMKYITTGRPFVTAKFAMSLDGKIATHTGKARWISGPDARRWVHQLRDVTDAIMVGVNTILADDPRLTTRLNDGGKGRGNEEARHPLRVIADSRGRAPLTAKVLADDTPGQTLIATTEAMPLKKQRALERLGAQVLVLPARHGGWISLPHLLDALGERQVTCLLVEGGGTLLASFFEQRLVDTVLAFIAPLIVGGRQAPTPVAGQGVARLSQALQLEKTRVERVGADVLISGYVTSRR